MTKLFLVRGLPAFIEIKGRAKGADSVVVTHNEIMACLNNGDSFILAIVEVDGNNTHVTDIGRPFSRELERSLRHSEFGIRRLLEEGEVIYRPAGARNRQ